MGPASTPGRPTSTLLVVAGDVEGNLSLYSLSYPTLEPTLLMVYPAHITSISGLYNLLQPPLDDIQVRL